MLIIVYMLNVAATISMFGIIWFVQIVHYPLFSLVGDEQFCHYEKTHQKLTTLVVAPLMLIELATSIAISLYAINEYSSWLPHIALALVLGIWLSTFLIQVPLHAKLDKAFDKRAHTLLVRSNWIRTILWSFRLPMVLWMFYLA